MYTVINNQEICAEGYNVGNWTKRGYVAGGTLSAAIFKFSGVSEHDFADGLRLEMVCVLDEDFRPAALVRMAPTGIESPPEPMMTLAQVAQAVNIVWGIGCGLAFLVQLRRIVREVSKELEKIDPAALKKDFATIVEGSAEDTEPAEEAGAEGAAMVPKAGGKTPNLDQFTVNLTENARKGKIDAVLGRDFEIHHTTVQFEHEACETAHGCVAVVSEAHQP